nr:uncharacterized protein LOC111753273 [Cavia porcellus]
MWGLQEQGSTSVLLLVSLSPLRGSLLIRPLSLVLCPCGRDTWQGGIAVACMSSASWAWFLGPGGAVEYCKPRVVIPGWAVGCGCPWPGGWPLPAWACSLRLAVARKLLRAPVLPLSSAPLDAADGGGGLDWDSPCQHTQGSCPARTPSAEVPAPGHQRTSKGCRPVSSLPTSCGPVDGSGQASGQCSPGQLLCRIPPGGARPLLQASCPESPLHTCGRMSAVSACVCAEWMLS